MNADHDLLTSLARLESARPEAEECTTLSSDVTCILLQCHRDRDLPPIFAQGVDSAAVRQFAGVFAQRLAPLIGGRYVPKFHELATRAARDEAVLAAFTGRNHKDIMRQFCISRALLYSILARKRRVVQQ